MSMGMGKNAELKLDEVMKCVCVCVCVRGGGCRIYYVIPLPGPD